MKRHPELERAILLAIEAHDDEAGGFADLSEIEGFSEAQKGYHVLLLHEAGLLVALDARTHDGLYDWCPVRLTMAGHQYLETIRDPEIWRRTQESARRVGSFGLDVLGALGKVYLRERLQALTGIDVRL